MPLPRLASRRTTIWLALAVVTAVLAGCGPDMISHDEFVERARPHVLEGFFANGDDLGLSRSELNRVSDKFLDCIWDVMSASEDTLRALAQDSSDAALQKAMEGRARPCADRLGEIFSNPPEDLTTLPAAPGDARTSSAPEPSS